MNIQKIPLNELKDDRAASIIDARLCDIALSLGIATYDNNESVKHRMEVNQKIVRAINAELVRREQHEGREKWQVQGCRILS